MGKQRGGGGGKSDLDLSEGEYKWGSSLLNLSSRNETPRPYICEMAGCMKEGCGGKEA